MRARIIPTAFFKGGPRENVIAGETGLVVGGGDDRSLYRGIATLISDPSRLKQMGQTARAYVEELLLLGWAYKVRDPPW